MFRSIVQFSIKKKFFVALATIILLISGIYSMLTLPIDAVPDITNNQVQIVTVSPTLAPQEVEQLITMPIEIAMSNIMNVVEIRSVSRFGLSLVTVVFEEKVPTLQARQLINEQIQTVAGEIPAELGTPELMPITTGLGEIYQYILRVDDAHKDKYDAMELRTIQDWIVKRQLSGIPGIVEINSFGGYMKQYEIAIDPDMLSAQRLTISDVFDALEKNNQNTGGSYIEKGTKAYYIRSEGMISQTKDIEKIVIANRGGMPVHIRDIGRVSFGAPKRFGAMTIDGQGECVGGIAMMLKGANANVVTQVLEDRVQKVQRMLPEGITIEPYLNRSELVWRNISTVIYNLVEGALIVFIVLIILLGNIRAGLIVASVIPLAMLFSFILMRIFGVSANLMSLGAIDFGIVVDGSIVILEGILAHIYSRRHAGRTLTSRQMEAEVEEGASHVVKSSTFAVLIILIVFFPILTLTGIEGKYFTPMAQTLVFCIIGALILSLTYVPMMASLFLKRKTDPRPTPADRLFAKLNKAYDTILHVCLRNVWKTTFGALAMLATSLWLFTRLGAEFIPTLDEGDFAMQMTLPAGSSLSQSIDLSLQAEKILKQRFPEIRHVVAKIGTAEVPTDPMSVEDADIMIVMKPFKQWTSASSRAEMVDKMKSALADIQGAEFNFSQPIQLRFNELMTGAKADIAIKLYGEDMEELYAKARQAAHYVAQVPGASDVIVEQAMGLPQLVVHYDRDKLARYGIDIKELNDIIRTAYAGETAGVVFENERRFDLVVRLDSKKVSDLDLNRLYVRTTDGTQIPVSQVATIDLVNGPLQINRDATKRRIVIGVNVRDADIQQVVQDISHTLEANIKLKPGYHFEYGGQFENLQNAIRTLLIVIPIALSLILLLLFLAFRSLTYTLVVFSTVPLSLIGGILALWLRGLPFSISAGVGFIALFGVAVLNGILMINHYNTLRHQKPHPLSTHRIILRGSSHLLRPVLLTGLTATLGFVPMAIATSAGAEVQRPLATVVIGGLIVSTILTLIIIPTYYHIVNTIPIIMRHIRQRRHTTHTTNTILILIIIATASLCTLHAQAQAQADSPQPVSLSQAISLALELSPQIKAAQGAIEQAKASRGESWDPGNTQINYSWGQLNGADHDDYELSIEQPLGTPLTPIYRHKLANTLVATSQTKKELTTRHVETQVRLAWQDYLLALSTSRLLSQQTSEATHMLAIAQARHEQGDINRLEYLMLKTTAATLQAQARQAHDQLTLATRRFTRACHSPHPPIPSDTTLIPLPTPQESDISPLHTQLIDQELKAKDHQLKIERSRYLPEFSIGYSLQKITPQRGLDAWSVGATIPLLLHPQHSRVKQAKTAQAIAQWEAQSRTIELRATLDELQSNIRQKFKHIQYYHDAALEQADELQRNALTLYRESETTATELLQSLATARTLRQEYYTTIHQYNTLIIQYQAITQ